jgi:hypothetical protein
MKTILSILLVALATASGASAQEPSVNIQINVNHAWWMGITPAGSLAFGSLLFSDPMGKAVTKDGVIDHAALKKKIMSGEKFTGANPEMLAVATLDSGEKFLVGEDIVLEILETAGKANQWQGPGVSTTLREFLARDPILKNKEQQNKALAIPKEPKPEQPKE